MAIALEQAFGATNGATASSIVFPSWSPQADELVLVGVSILGNNVPTSITGNGLAFVLITQIADRPAPTYTHSIYRAMGASPTTGAVTVNLPVSTAAIATLARLSGTDHTGANGSGAIEVIVTGQSGATGTQDYMLDITTLTDEAWAWSSGDHRNSPVVLEVGEIPVSINTFEGAGGAQHSASTFYIEMPTAGLITLGGINNLSGNTDRWGMAGLSIKPDAGVPPPVVVLTAGAVATFGELVDVVAPSVVEITEGNLVLSTEMTDVIVPNIIQVMSPGATVVLAGTVTLPKVEVAEVVAAELSLIAPVVTIDAPAGIEVSPAVMGVQAVTLADVDVPADISVVPAQLTVTAPFVELEASTAVAAISASVGVTGPQVTVRAGLVVTVLEANLIASGEILEVHITPVVEIQTANVIVSGELLTVGAQTFIEINPAEMLFTAPVHRGITTPVIEVSPAMLAALPLDLLSLKTATIIIPQTINLAATTSEFVQVVAGPTGGSASIRVQFLIRTINVTFRFADDPTIK